MAELYDSIGLNYSNLRKPDVRIAARIQAALADAKTVLNVGAGAGSYEPKNKIVTALEPSAEMIAQRPKATTNSVQGCAESIPFADKSFDASMAVLTIHHWSDQAKGAAEMRRVTRGKIVFLTYDPAFRGFWLFDYFPDLVTLDEEQMPGLSLYEDWFGPIQITNVDIPADCTDGFLAGYWKRPSAYLDPRVRRAMSSFWALGDQSAGLQKLQADLESGHWHERYGDVMNENSLDCGYRLVETI